MPLDNCSFFISFSSFVSKAEFNLSKIIYGNDALKEHSPYSKFVVYTIKDNDIYTYSQDVEVILDNYINIHNYNHGKSMEDLIKGINEKNPKLELHNVYTSTKLTSMCFTILDEIVRKNF